MHLRRNHVNSDLIAQANIQTAKRLREEADRIEQESQQWHWQTQDMEAPVSTKLGLGVYMYIYRPSGVAYYVGRGKLYQRFNRAKQIFRNGGKPIVCQNSTASYQGASKMYNKDPDLSKWVIHYVDGLSESTSRELEMMLQNEYNIPFSKLYMAGV